MAKNYLDEYSAKRAFDLTPEPAAIVPKRRNGPLLFVVQLHAASRLHYDLRLELDGVLKSWAIPKGPSLDPGEKRFAALTEDHPYDYASFEGVIPPKQYGAGEMIVWDCGVYSPDEEGPTAFDDRERAEREVRDGFEKGKIGFELRGEKLKGSFALVRMKEKTEWLLIKHKDRFVSKADVTARDRSVLSGASVEDLKVVPAQRTPTARLVPSGPIAAMPRKLEPMLAEAGDAVFNRGDWMWEPKLDGYRVIAFIAEGRAVLRSRDGRDLAATFPALAAELALQSREGMVLDGELVSFDANGKPSFAALQERAQLKAPHEIEAADRSHPVAFVAFDLLHFAGVDLREAPYRDRRRHLAQCVMPSPRVQLVHASEDGAGLARAARALGFAGVIGKRLDGPYETGKRSASWIEVKAGDRRSREGGNPGKALPRVGLDSRLRGNDVVAQLDAAKKDFTLAVDGHRIKLTHLDRVYWPANPALKEPPLTKRDLLRYLAQVSPFMLPHLADRPLTMIRMPSGIGGQRFFQKHWEQDKPRFVDTIDVFSGHKDESHEYLLCNNLATLLWLAQAGTLEFHVWHSRAKPGPDAATQGIDYDSSLESMEASVLNYPDYVLFDLDPYIYSGKEAKGAEPELNTAAFEKGKRSRSGCASSCRACRSSPS